MRSSAPAPLRCLTGATCASCCEVSSRRREGPRRAIGAPPHLCVTGNGYPHSDVLPSTTRYGIGDAKPAENAKTAQIDYMLFGVPMLPTVADAGSDLTGRTTVRAPTEIMVADDSRLARARGGSHRELFVEAAVVVVLASATFVVHPMSYDLHRAYWLDEAWVGVLSKAPLRDWVSLSSSTPLGWLLLLRWVPAGRDGLRIVPLVFSAATVAIAFVFARGAGWKSVTFARIAGVAAALIALLTPVALGRNDLKQYTADSFFALVVLVLASRAERTRSLRAFAALGATSAVAVFFSSTAVFVTIAVFVGLFVSALFTRSLRYVGIVAVTGVVTGALQGLYFATVIVPNDNPALRAYWKSRYLTGGPVEMASRSWDSLKAIETALAMPAIAFVLVGVFGAVVLAANGRPGVALSVPMLWIEMTILAHADRFPFLDKRTSHFLLIPTLVFVAIGAVGLLVIIAKRSVLASIIAGVIVTALFFNGTYRFILARTIPREDARALSLYIAHHLGPGDVVVVSQMGQYGYAYYWPHARRKFSVDRSGTLANGFTVALTNGPPTVYAAARTPDAITAAVQRGVAIARQLHGSHVWVIESHAYGVERTSFETAAAASRLPDRILYPGTEPLIVISMPHSASSN